MNYKKAKTLFIFITILIGSVLTIFSTRLNASELSTKTLLEITREGIKLRGGAQFVVNSRSSFPLQETTSIIQLPCKTRQLHGKWAIPFSCFKKNSSLIAGLQWEKPMTKSPLGFQLEMFLDPETPDFEFLLSYSSGFRGGYHLSIQNTLNHPRAQWFSHIAWLGNFPQTAGQYSILWAEPVVSHIQERLDFYHTMLSYGNSHFGSLLKEENRVLEADRFELLKHQNFFTLPEFEIYLSSVQLVPGRSESTDNLLQELRKGYENFIRIQPGNFFWTSLLVVVLALAAIAYYRIAYQIFLLYLIQLLCLFWFSLNSLFPIVIRGFETQLKEVELELIQEFESWKERLLDTELRQIDEIRNLKTMILSQYEGSLMDYGLILTSLEAKTRDLQLQEDRAIQIRELKLAIHQYMKEFSAAFQVEKGVIERERIRMETIYSPVNQENTVIRQWIREILVQTHPLVFFLRKQHLLSGLSLTLTNGNIYFSKDRIGPGADSKLGLQGMMNSLLMGELTNDMDKAQQKIRVLREVMNELRLDSRELDNYLSHPLRFQPGMSRKKYQEILRHSWEHIRVDGKDWIMNIRIGHNSLLNRFHEILTLNLPEKEGLFYYLTGFNQNVSYPASASNHPHLSMIGSTLQAKGVPGFSWVREEDGIYLYYGATIQELGRYTYIVGRKISPGFELLSTRILLFQISSTILVLLIFLASFFVGNLISTPIKNLYLGLTRILRREYDKELDVLGVKVFARLGTQFNRLLRFLREKEEISAFMAPEAAGEIINQPTQASREDVAVLFASILNFEAFDSTEDQTQLVDEFLNLCHRGISNHHGMIDKFTGKACLGIFQGEHRIHGSLHSCFELRPLITAWNQNRREMGLKPVRVGVGIAAGPVVLGHVGSSQRKDYTAIGNTVNMAARLSTKAVEFFEEFILLCDSRSHEVEIQSFSFKWKRLGELEIKGKKDRQTIYQAKWGSPLS